MVNYACVFSQSEWGKYVELIIIVIIIITMVTTGKKTALTFTAAVQDKK